jgi:hypothetical protein
MMQTFRTKIELKGQYGEALEVVAAGSPWPAIEISVCSSGMSPRLLLTPQQADLFLKAVQEAIDRVKDDIEGE